MYPYIFRILVPFICNGDLERFPLAKTKRTVDPKLSVKVRLGIVGTLYSRSSKSSVQHILTYLPSYCKICGEWVVYAETVTIMLTQLQMSISAILDATHGCSVQVGKFSKLILEYVYKTVKNNKVSS